MAEEAARRHLILTELFGVPPRAIVDALVVSANEHLYVVGERLEEHVRALLGDGPDADHDAEQGVHAVLTLMENVIDHVMDTFELYCLRSIFAITPEQSRRITLAHHRGLDLRSAELPQLTDGRRSAQEPLPVVPDEEDALRRRIAGHRLAQAERAAKVRLERAETMRAAYAFLVHALQAPRDADSLVDVARAVRDQIPHVLGALRRLQDVHPLTQALLPPKAPTDAEEERSEWEKGRDAYLNWEANRIIANMKRAHADAVDTQ